MSEFTRNRKRPEEEIPVVPAAGRQAQDPFMQEQRAVMDGGQNADMVAANREQAVRIADLSRGSTFTGNPLNQGSGSEQARMTKERLQEAVQTLMKYKAGKASVERRIIHAQQWWKLRNWNEIELERRTKGATVRKSNTAWLWNCIVGKHADAMDAYPEPVILPRMLDDKDEAKMLSDIVPVVMSLNNFKTTYSDASWQKFQEGTGAYSVTWDKNKTGGMGDISIKKTNLLNLHWESGITDIQDSKELFYTTLVDNRQLEQQFPQLKGKLKSTSIVVAKYLYDDNVDTTDKSVVIDWYYHTWNGPKKILQYCQFVGEEVLFATEDDPAMRERGLYDDGDYPFVLDPLFPVEGSPCGYGYIDIGKDAQADIDTLNQAMVQNAVTSSTPRYFMRKDGGVNEEEFSDWSKPIIHVNGMLGQDSLTPVQVNRLDGNSMNMLQQKIEELKFITGNMDVQNGGTSGGATAASAIAAQMEAAGRSSKDQTASAYRAYGKIVKMVIERIRQFYDMDRWFRIMGERGEEQFVKYNNSGIVPQPIMGGMGVPEDGYRIPEFDIDVRAQRENAYSKVSQNELALQFYNLGMFNPQMTDQVLMCLDMMDFKGKDELQQKIEQQGTMQEALMQVGQIALALAQKYQPEVADQLAMTLQGIAGDQMSALMAKGGMAGELKGVTSQQNEAAKPSDPNENTVMKKARQRMENSVRPN